MKLFRKILGIAALTAVIGFFTIACDDGSVIGNGNGNGSEIVYPPIPTGLNLITNHWGNKTINGTKVDAIITADDIKNNETEKLDMQGGYQWESEYINLSNILRTTKPKKNNLYTFTISGTVDTDLNGIVIQLCQIDGDDYKWLGDNSIDKILIPVSSGTFQEEISIQILNDADSRDVYLQLVNLLWRAEWINGSLDMQGGDLENDEDIENGVIKATITNFDIVVNRISTITGGGAEQKHDNQRWWKFVDSDNSNTAGLNYSIDDDGICTINVTGTPVSEPWRATIGYEYTAIEGRIYEYTFDAWTETGTRDLHVQYYEDNEKQIWLNTTINITNVRNEYTVRGEILPEDRAESLRFQSADATGTYYVKIKEIKELIIGKIKITNFPINSPFPNGSRINGWSNMPNLWIGTPYAYDGGGIGLDDVRIYDSTIIISVWEEIYENGDRKFVPYKGSGNVETEYLFLNINYDVGNGSWTHDRYKNKVPITFNNGNANINFATQMEKLPKDELTATFWTLTTGEYISFDYEKSFNSSLYYGTYIISGDTVIFTYWDNEAQEEKTITGTLSGNSLDVPGFGTFTRW